MGLPPPPTLVRGEGTLACGKGVGGVPIPTRGHTLLCSIYIRTLCSPPRFKVIAGLCRFCKFLGYLALNPVLFGPWFNLTQSRFRRDAGRSCKSEIPCVQEAKRKFMRNLSFFLASCNKTLKITLYHLKIWNLEKFSIGNCLNFQRGKTRDYPRFSCIILWLCCNPRSRMPRSLYWKKRYVPGCYRRLLCTSNGYWQTWWQVVVLAA